MKRFLAALLLALPFVVTMAPSVANTIRTIGRVLSEHVLTVRVTKGTEIVR